jgi:putative ABC transport system permease protein
VLARPRFALEVFGVFAMVALAVSAAGLYGIIAYAVTQRTREIGVRVALGAEPGAVARLVLGDSARLVIGGGVLGLLGGYAGTRVLASFLYGPADGSSGVRQCGAVAGGRRIHCDADSAAAGVAHRSNGRAADRLEEIGRRRQ